LNIFKFLEAFLNKQNKILAELNQAMVVWKRLIRFVAEDEHVYNGEPILAKETDDIGALADEGKLDAFVIEGSDVYSSTATVTSKKLAVKRLLGPLTADQVPIIRCVGLNYMAHIKEGGRKPPPYPSIFIKPADCVADYGCAVQIPQIAQDEQCDYEGELVSFANRIEVFYADLPSRQ
jgi:2-keto-4-pentenoate hydratase/2-oxohepta-3-ene-1,7-dioic acid hydratase in catechol pathway